MKKYSNRLLEDLLTNGLLAKHHVVSQVKALSLRKIFRRTCQTRLLIVLKVYLKGSLGQGSKWIKNQRKYQKAGHCENERPRTLVRPCPRQAVPPGGNWPGNPRHTGRKRLRLLPSGPDRVHDRLLRGPRPPLPVGRTLPKTKASGGNSTPL